LIITLRVVIALSPTKNVYFFHVSGGRVLVKYDLVSNK